MRAYPYPLPAEALFAFVHPNREHDLSNVFHDTDGTIYAGNGYLALKGLRGAWLPTDFPALSPEARRRFTSLPWEAFDLIADAKEWHLLDDHRARIFERSRIGLFLAGKPAPSPVWMVGPHLVRLSFLQAITRLPRAQVYTGTHTGTHFLARFSGGYVILPRDKSLGSPAARILQPKTDAFGQEILHTGPRPTFSLPGWPPPIDPDQPIHPNA
jgi:hypothetical protein